MDPGPRTRLLCLVWVTVLPARVRVRAEARVLLLGSGWPLGVGLLPFPFWQEVWGLQPTFFPPPTLSVGEVKCTQGSRWSWDWALLASHGVCSSLRPELSSLSLPDVHKGPST